MPWKTRAENKLCGILLVCVCARSHMGAVLLAGRDPVEAPRAAPSQPVAAVVDHGLQDLLPGALPDESGHLAARVPQPARPGVIEPPDGLPGRPGGAGPRPPITGTELIPWIMMPWKTRAENKLCGTLLVCVCARLLFVVTTRMWVAFWSFNTSLRNRTIMCWTSYCPPGVFGATL